MTDAVKIDIILPTLNEAANLPSILPLLKAYAVSVIDDGSQDDTVAVAQKYGAGVINRENAEIKGLTASVIEGIKNSQANYIIVMDADMQHPPSAIPEIVALLSKHDLVICRRRRVLSRWPLHRKIVSKSAILLGCIRLFLAGKYYHDIMSGFFGAKATLLKDTIRRNEPEFEMEGYKVLFDLLKYMPRIKAGYVEYDFGLRGHGRSQLKMRHYICYLRSLFK